MYASPSRRGRFTLFDLARGADHRHATGLTRFSDHVISCLSPAPGGMAATRDRRSECHPMVLRLRVRDILGCTLLRFDVRVRAVGMSRQAGTSPQRSSFSVSRGDTSTALLLKHRGVRMRHRLALPVPTGGRRGGSLPGGALGRAEWALELAATARPDGVSTDPLGPDNAEARETVDEISR
jgi:hypothetical protein